MIYTFGDFVVSEERRELSHAGSVVAVEPKVFDVLLFLIENRDRVVTRQELFDVCWPNVFVNDGTLSRCLSRVRQALGQDRTADEPILTLHRKGYRFASELSVEPSPGQESVELSDLSIHEPGVDSQSPATAPLPAVAERRYLSVLDCRFSEDGDIGASAHAPPRDVESFYSAVRNCHDAAKQIGDTLGGIVAMRSGQGLRLHFGQPVALERPAEAAVFAARRLIAQAGQVGLNTHIGITTGSVIVEPRDPSSPNSVVAARMFATDPAVLAGNAQAGDILVDERTRRLVANQFESAHVTASHGSDDVFRLGRQRPPPRLVIEDEPFIGRSPERVRLRQLWESATRGRTQVGVVSGQAGIGKSRLINQLCNDIEIEHNALWPAVCSPHHRLTPFHPLLELMRQELGITADTPKIQQLVAIEKLLERLGQPTGDHLPLLASLLADTGEHAEARPLDLDPERQRARTLEAIVFFVLAQAKSQPTILWVDNAEAADASTIEALGKIAAADSDAQLLVLIATRDTEILSDSLPTESVNIPLQPFTDAETERFLDEQGDYANLPFGLVKPIAERSDGVPLFLREFVLMARHGDDLSVKDAGTPSVAIPDNLRALLLARLDTAGDARIVAQWAACLGREFNRDLLARASEIAPEQLGPGLQQLVASGILEQPRLAERSRYMFSHQLMCDLAYDTMLTTTRAKQHAAIANALVTSFPEIAKSEPERIARHFDAAGMPADAARYWGACGKASIARQASQEAEAALGHARGAVAKMGESAEAARLLAEIDALLAAA